MTRRLRASPASTPSRMRSEVNGTFRAARCRTPWSLPLQRTPWFQGVSPLMSPLRTDTVSSTDSLAPPMGFVPLQGRSFLAVDCDVQRASQQCANALSVGTGRRSSWRITMALPAAIPRLVALQQSGARALLRYLVPGPIPAVPPFQRFAGGPTRAWMCLPPKRSRSSRQAPSESVRVSSL